MKIKRGLFSNAIDTTKAPYRERVQIIIDQYDAEDLVLEIAHSMQSGASFEEVLTYIEEELGIENKPWAN